MNMYLGQASTPVAVVPMPVTVPVPTPGPVSASVLQAVAADTDFWDYLQSLATVASESTQLNVAIPIMQQEVAGGVNSTFVQNVMARCPTAGSSVAAFEGAVIAQLSNGVCGSPYTSGGASGGTSAFPWTFALIGAGVLVLVMVMER